MNKLEIYKDLATNEALLDQIKMVLSSKNYNSIKMIGNFVVPNDLHKEIDNIKQEYLTKLQAIIEQANNVYLKKLTEIDRQNESDEVPF